MKCFTMGSKQNYKSSLSSMDLDGTIEKKADTLVCLEDINYDNLDVLEK